MPSTFDTMVGKRIKKQRMEINYSQEQLAASTNCSYRCIQNGSQERRCRERRCYAI